jgi:hypothetical protein
MSEHPSEDAVGIRAFIRGIASAPRFCARIKQSPDDFLVTEMDLSGRPVALLDSNDASLRPPPEVPG